ncbi:MAG: hypothetical protein AAF696_06590 [Bacteroidota bacterium]
MIFFRYLFLSTFICCLSFQGSAQNERDALRHSYYGISGTARAQGMGGAFSAVGADMSAASLNPAGLGLYRSSSFTYSPGFSNARTQSDYFNQSNTTNLSNFYSANFGVVFHGKNYEYNGRNRVEKSQGLKSFTFGFGFNQLERYNRSLNVSAFNTESSITDMFAERANNRNAFPSELPADSWEALAFDVFAIDTLANSGTSYFPAVNGGDIEQTLRLNEEGYRNEWFVSIAGNIDDFFYIGFTLGFQTVRYEQNLYFEENDVDNLHQFFENDPNSAFPLETPMNQVRFQDEFSTRGSGVNGQLGIIVRPIDPLRIGVSVKSPTYFNLRDQFTTTIGQNFTIELNNGQLGEQDESFTSTPGEFRYSLNTPFRATAGLMYLFGKSGFLTADVDFTDYSTAQLNSDVDDFFRENARIQGLYKQVLSYRFGGEFRAGILRLRAGAAFIGDPLEDAAKRYLSAEDFTTIERIAGDRKLFSLGIGVRQPNYFFDVSFINQMQEDKVNPYSVDATEIFTPTAANSTTRSSVLMTLGFNF